MLASRTLVNHQVKYTIGIQSIELSHSLIVVPILGGDTKLWEVGRGKGEGIVMLQFKRIQNHKTASA